MAAAAAPPLASTVTQAPSTRSSNNSSSSAVVVASVLVVRRPCAVVHGGVLGIAAMAFVAKTTGNLAGLEQMWVQGFPTNIVSKGVDGDDDGKVLTLTELHGKIPFQPQLRGMGSQKKMGVDWGGGGGGDFWLRVGMCHDMAF